jgi:hypothetical protein
MKKQKTAPGSPSRRWRISGARRLFVIAAAFLSCALGLTALDATPALADVDASYTSLSTTFGHTCSLLGTNADGYEAVICIEVGLYTSAATGQTFVTAQVEGICETKGGVYQQCYQVSVVAGIDNPSSANEGLGDEAFCGPGATACNPNGRTYFFPFNGLAAPTTPGDCTANVWAVANGYGATGESPTGVDTGDGQLYYLQDNLGTPHYNVCMDAAGNLYEEEIT